MSNKLVIIESPGKLKSYRKYLPPNFTVIASMGHVLDLPEKDLGIDIKSNFAPTFMVMKDKKDTLEEIKSAAAKCDEVFIATDPDREGAGIGWNIAQQLPKKLKIKRAKTQSITKSGIEKALSDATEMNEDEGLVNAFKARRMLDRICGYKTSYIVKMATGGMSAGRTQSATLRILAERELEIKAFKPEEYWPITAELLTAAKKKIIASIKTPDEKDIKNGADAKKIVEIIRKGPAIVSKFEKKEVNTRAGAPFTTSTMYQAAAIFGWKSDKTASVAQKLYEAGVITYHRTDSTYLIPEFISNVRSLVKSEYGDRYLPDKPNYFGASKNAQEAHEACRCTDLALREYVSGGTDEAKLYQMIWKRSVACQMAEMEKLSMSAEFKVDKYILKASGSKLVFDGWYKVWDYGSISDTILPELKIGEELDVLDVKTEQKFTEPPPRYNERSLIKKLEQEGIGRPSTYSSIPKTLEARKYIDNGKNITVTDLGLKVNDFMCKVGFCFVEVKFTAEMEQKLDDIAMGKADCTAVLTEFWDRLKKDISKSKEFKKDKNITEFDCPECAKHKKESKLCLRDSRFGKFFSCELYPECKYKASYGEDGKPFEKEPKVVKTSAFPCPSCGEMMVVRTGKKSGKEFLGCPKWPKCKGKICDLDGNPIEFKSKKWGKKKWVKKGDDNDG